MESLRTFIAIDVKVEQELKKKWVELKSLLRNDNIKWVDEHTIHLTLFFLGDTPINQIEGIAQRLELNLRKTLSFKIFLNGFGTFGNRNLPKVIWIGIAESRHLFRLKENIDLALSTLALFESNGKFSPHLTLGRVKQIKSSNDLMKYIDGDKSDILQEVEVDRIVFYQSILKPTGPTYIPLKEIKLLSL